MGEIKVNGIFWATYWSPDGEHETGENFASESERAAKALEMLGRGWTVAFGDFAGLQEKMIRAAKEYDESLQVQKDRVDEIIGLLGRPHLFCGEAGHECSGPEQNRDRPADPNDQLWPAYWLWFARQEPELYKYMSEPLAGSANLARQEDFNCWKEHRQDILNAWNAWKQNHPMTGASALMQHKFIESLPERDQEFIVEIGNLLQ